uniref:Uncharacterized protein n=1 Tax=Anguilla anguilla TaxID=7936 RepID=A0A0E9S686_ANGAN
MVPQALTCFSHVLFGRKGTAFLSDSARPLLFAQDLCSARSVWTKKAA